MGQPKALTGHLWTSSFNFVLCWLLSAALGEQKGWAKLSFVSLFCSIHLHFVGQIMEFFFYLGI